MAQIRVEERNRGYGWLWSLIAVLIAAALVWYFMSERRTTSGGDVAPTKRDTTAMAPSISSSAQLLVLVVGHGIEGHDHG